MSTPFESSEASSPRSANPSHAFMLSHAHENQTIHNTRSHQPSPHTAIIYTKLVIKLN